MVRKSKQKATTFDAPAHRLALALACRDQKHFPYSLEFTEAEGDLRFVHAWVRTTSWEWDGCGGRTDLHEIFATFWAALLRANGVASAELMDFEGWGGPGEIYSRVLVIRQPFDSFLRNSDSERFQLLRAHTALASHQLAEAFSLTDFREVEPKWQEKSLPWLDDVRAHFGKKVNADLFVERTNPKWCYYKAGNRMTLLEIPPACCLSLRQAFCFYAPQAVQHSSRLIISAFGIHNAVPLAAIRRAEKLLQVIDRSQFAHFTGNAGQFDQPGLLVVPLENHCVLIGGSAGVILRTDCGYDAFVKARESWDYTDRRAAAVFGQSGSFVWPEHVDSERLAELVEDLAAVEPGVARVRSAGPHTERDQGRDLIIDWVRIIDATAQPPKLRTDHVLVQIKFRGRTIGKSDVRDVRDTIERHSADGYLLVGYPQFSGDLINYLETLRQRGHSIDWWSKKQLEDRLRKNLDILARFHDIVRYCPPAGAGL